MLEAVREGRRETRQRRDDAFDGLARALAQPVSRRRTLGLLGVAVLGGLGAAPLARAAWAPRGGAGPGREVPCGIRPPYSFPSYCPTGHECCGSDHCCPSDHEYCSDQSGRGTCSCKPELVCGVTCCPAGWQCISAFCCPPGATSCAGQCCDAGSECVQGEQCLPACSEGTIRCGTDCCEAERCLGGICVTPCTAKQIRCADRCCEAASEECVDGECIARCPRGERRCGKRGCCSADERCRNGVCEPCESEVACGAACCRVGETCRPLIQRGARRARPEARLVCCPPRRRNGGGCCPHGTHPVGGRCVAS